MVLDGVILIGGKSRRFGSNKANITIAGKTLLERTRELMHTALGTPPIIVGGDQHSDKRSDVGPLGGVETAFEISSADALVIVACDMPGLSAELIQYLAKHPSQSTVVMPRVNDYPHPLCARWCRNAKETITSALDEGRHSVRELLTRLDVTIVDASELIAHQINPHQSLFNVNHPADLAHYQSKYRT